MLFYHCALLDSKLRNGKKHDQARSTPVATVLFSADPASTSDGSRAFKCKKDHDFVFDIDR